MARKPLRPTGFDPKGHHWEFWPAGLGPAGPPRRAWLASLFGPQALVPKDRPGGHGSQASLAHRPWSRRTALKGMACKLDTFCGPYSKRFSLFFVHPQIDDDPFQASSPLRCILRRTLIVFPTASSEPHAVAKLKVINSTLDTRRTRKTHRNFKSFKNLTLVEIERWFPAIFF